MARGVTVRGLGVNTLAVAVAGILCCAGTARAADDQTTAAASPSDQLQEVVVTASAQGVKKLDASYNIVTANLDQIKMGTPRVRLKFSKSRQEFGRKPPADKPASISTWPASPMAAATRRILRP